MSITEYWLQKKAQAQAIKGISANALNITKYADKIREDFDKCISEYEKILDGLPENNPNSAALLDHYNRLCAIYKGLFDVKTATERIKHAND